MLLKPILVADFTSVQSGGFPSAVAPDVAAHPLINYYDDIKPLLAVHCYKCHDGETSKGGLRLDTSTTALAGGESGNRSIVQGAGSRSQLVRRISTHAGDDIMPPKNARLTETEVARIQQWIDESAKWPERDD